MLGVLLLVLVATLAVSLIAFLRQRHRYWKSRGVPGPRPSIPFGHFLQSCLGRRNVCEEFQEMYQKYKHERYIGLNYMHTPLLQLHDLDIIKDVMIKEFQDFNGRGMYSEPDKDKLSGHLFNLSGQSWRNMRVKLSPSFTIGKVKHMFSRVHDCAKNLQEHVGKAVHAAGGAYKEDVRELIARYATDITSSVIFGVESNTMNNPDSDFRRMGRCVFDPNFVQGWRFNLEVFAKDIMRHLGISSMSPTVHEFFSRMIGDTVQYREANNVSRADMLDLLIQLKNKGFMPPDSKKEVVADASEENLQKLNMGQVIAQVFIFFIAGFETSSTTASFTLYELAKSPEVLEKVIKEIDEVMEKHNGNISYEAVMSVPYLEQAISETLRLHPPVPFLTREAMRQVNLPRTELLLERGTTLVIPVSAIHCNPDIWPSPDTYNPDRFTEENKKKIPQMAYLPFGDGPRLCIGMRLGMVQVKAALIAILSRYRVSRCADTPERIVIEPWSIVPAPIGGLNVLLSKREEVRVP